ncbi:hypothetical protein GCM10027570_11980 [Streptomonospora sediminis]
MVTSVRRVARLLRPINQGTGWGVFGGSLSYCAAVSGRDSHSRGVLRAPDGQNGEAAR